MPLVLASSICPPARAAESGRRRAAANPGPGRAWSTPRPACRSRVSARLLSSARGMKPIPRPPSHPVGDGRHAPGFDEVLEQLPALLRGADRRSGPSLGTVARAIGPRPRRASFRRLSVDGRAGGQRNGIIHGAGEPIARRRSSLANGQATARAADGQRSAPHRDDLWSRAIAAASLPFRALGEVTQLWPSTSAATPSAVRRGTNAR